MAHVEKSLRKMVLCCHRPLRCELNIAVGVHGWQRQQRRPPRASWHHLRSLTISAGHYEKYNNFVEMSDIDDNDNGCNLLNEYECVYAAAAEALLFERTLPANVSDFIYGVLKPIRTHLLNADTSQCTLIPTQRPHYHHHR